MTALGGRSALADLVTQAPPEDHGQHRQGGLARLCSCSWMRRPAGDKPKLASVVPAPDGHKAQCSTAAVLAQKLAQKLPEKDESPQVAAVAGAPVADPADPAEDHCWRRVSPDGPPQLPKQVGDHVGRKTLVLDLDETLVHSSFRPTVAADIIITLELEGEEHKVFVRKRPGVDEFLMQVARFFEVVVYTASLAKYANPLLDELDKSQTVTHRLFREACTRRDGNSGYMKDLSKLGRDLRHIIIIDNSPICYALQPDNAIPIRTWRDDPSDRELYDLLPILCSLVSVDDIPAVLHETVWQEED